MNPAPALDIPPCYELSAPIMAPDAYENLWPPDPKPKFDRKAIRKMKRDAHMGRKRR